MNESKNVHDLGLLYSSVDRAPAYRAWVTGFNPRHYEKEKKQKKEKPVSQNIWMHRKQESEVWAKQPTLKRKLTSSNNLVYST